MFVLGNLFSAIGIVLRVFIDIETAVIIISAILSWIPGIQQFVFTIFSEDCQISLKGHLDVSFRISVT